MDMTGSNVLRILPRSQANAEALIRLIKTLAQDGRDDAMLTLLARCIDKKN